MKLEIRHRKSSIFMKRNAVKIEQESSLLVHAIIKK